MPLNGQRGAFSQPATWGSTEQGDFYTAIFEGTKEEVKQAAFQCALAGAQYQVTERFGISRLEARFSYNPVFGGGGTVEQPINQWEFFAAEAEKDLLDAKVESNIIGTLSDATRQMIYNAIHFASDTSAQPDPAAATNPANATYWAKITNTTERTNAQAVYNLMKDGVRSFPVDVPTLRHTQIVSNRWAIKVSLTNVRKIISTASLISLEAIPSAILFNLPNDTSSVTDKKYGWRKKFPNVQQVANLKFQLVQEWQYGLWPTVLFGQPI
jgi:hypothetical protein